MDATEHGRIDRSHDWANVAFGAALIVAPWLYHYADATPVAVTGWATGALVAIIALAAILRFAEWEEWVEVALGLWIIAAPFIVGFVSFELAVQVHVIIGILLLVSTGMKLWHVHHPSPVTGMG